MPLKARGSVALKIDEGGLQINAPVLAGPWALGWSNVAEVVWIARTGTTFTSRNSEGTPCLDMSPVRVGLAQWRTDLIVRFVDPVRVPFRRGRRLWPRSAIYWDNPNPFDPRLLWPPKAVREGLATSVRMEARHDSADLKQALESAGYDFPEIGTPPGTSS